MNTPRTALLLVGSPKTGASSSGSLGAYLLEELETRGLQTQTFHVTKALRTDQTTDELRAAVASAGIVVVSFPLYIDSLPAPLMCALELMAAWRPGTAPVDHRPALVVICQSGFPEAQHNEVALEICRNFARAAEFEWAGGLVLGAGGMISGQPLRRLKGRMRSAVRALDLTADELAAGRAVPDEAVRLMAKPAFPAFAYRFMANYGWRHESRRNGAAPLDARPFA